MAIEYRDLDFAALEARTMGWLYRLHVTCAIDSIAYNVRKERFVIRHRAYGQPATMICGKHLLFPSLESLERRVKEERASA